ncbi:MAG TPA: hypothetical protein VHY80_19440 [Stellaceae bacterium]|nr:hypothetical protein [Stellaceae bacterium]
MKAQAALALSLLVGGSLAALVPAARAEDYSIKIGTGPVTASGPLYIAQDRGYFAA